MLDVGLDFGLGLVFLDLVLVPVGFDGLQEVPFVQLEQLQFGVLLLRQGLLFHGFLGVVVLQQRMIEHVFELGLGFDLLFG